MITNVGAGYYVQRCRYSFQHNGLDPIIAQTRVQVVKYDGPKKGTEQDFPWVFPLLWSHNGD